MFITLNLQQPPDPGYGLILSIGIRFGTPGENGNIKQVRRAESAKVLKGNKSW
jgi:hypothetical protein